MLPDCLLREPIRPSCMRLLRNTFTEDSVPRDGWGLVAVGGFGRGDSVSRPTSIFSFFIRSGFLAFLSELVHDLMYGLWDSAFEVGHATVSVSMVRNMVQNDFTILTNYLEAGWLQETLSFSTSGKGPFSNYSAVPTEGGFFRI